MNAARLKEVWQGLEPKGQLTLVASGLLVLVTLAGLFMLSSRPHFSTIASGLEASETADVTGALESAGIAYELRSGGTEVAVKDGQVASARVALAKQGLPRGGHVGFELFDKGSLGATDFQQKVNYQRALEGEIARTIEQIDGVGGAQVQLVLPEETLFADEGPKASAAVLLDTSMLDASTVRGIAHLVSSSVKGLDAGAVTITDQTGALLWPDGNAGPGGTSVGSRLRAEQLYAANVAAQINSVLAQTLGPNKATVRVRADLDLDERSIDSVTYAKKGTPLQTETKSERLRSTGGGAAGAAGTASNIPSYGGAAGGGNATSNYQQQTDSTTFGVDKTVERRVVAPGTVDRLDVALLVDESVPPAQTAQLEQTVRSLAGVDEARGDTIAVTRLAFADPAETTEEPAPSGPAAILENPMPIVKWVGAGLALLLFVLLMRRGLKRREGELVAAEPTWLREFERATPLAQLEAASSRMALESGLGEDPIAAELEELAKKQPEQIAAQVSSWLKE